jgi:hypothetical protein
MRIHPALVLFFLSPAIAELLLGSSPPSEFFNPVSFLLLASLYGSGSIVFRELKVRWGKSYISLFILGAAYGIIEEGLMVKSFFDPKWMDLGILGLYGRWLGVNWVWAEWLTIYHAVFSIMIPITIVELAFKDWKDKRWVGNKTLLSLIILLGLVTVFGYLALTPYRPPSIPYFLTFFVVIILILIAMKIPSKIGKKGVLNPLKPSYLLYSGFFIALFLFLIFMAGPFIIPQPLILMFVGIVFILAIGIFIKRYQWGKETSYHKFALVAGALGFLILLTPLQELDSTRIDDPKGMLIVGIVALILLILLARKIRSNQE